MERDRDKSLAEQAAFYRHLLDVMKHKGSQSQEKRAQLEIPKPPMYQPSAEQVERGIFIIQF